MLKPTTILFFLNIIITTFLGAWQGYELFDVGSKAAGLGGAYTAQADDLSAIYWNPAGLLAQKKMGWDLQFNLANFQLNELLSGQNATVNFFPSQLVMGIPLNRNFALGVGYFSPFSYDMQDIKFGLYAVGPAVAYKILPNVYLGGRLSLDIGYFNDKYGYGGSGGGGILVNFRQIKFGLSYQSPSYVFWPEKYIYFNVRETFPQVIHFGVMIPVKRYKVTLFNEQLTIKEEYSAYSLQLTYEDWSTASIRGEPDIPFPGQNLQPRLNGALGYQFQDPWLAILWRVALKTKTLYLNSVTGIASRQWLLCLGGGVFARKWFRFDFAVQDSSLTSVFFKENLPLLSFFITVRFNLDTQYSR